MRVHSPTSPSRMREADSAARSSELKIPSAMASPSAISSSEMSVTTKADAGVHGVLVTDLPLGADRPLEERLGSSPLAFVRLVAPTTPLARMREIGAHGRGFVYLISRTGVTGLREDVPVELPETIARLR